MSAILETPIGQRAYRREVFSVDGVRVILDDRGNWRCESRTCTQGTVCAHVVQARRFKEMRGKKRSATVIEIELTAAELRALTQAAVSPANDAVAAAPKRKLGYSAWPLVLAIAAIAAVLGVVTYVANRHTVTVATAPAYRVTASMAEPVPPAPPAEFANPFDRKEAFEYPPGTSEREAYDSEPLLRQRARHRLAQPAEPL
ncbi:MAG TPA: hypothetical protein VG994_05725 [Steroidobacteraceae bacterium]|nr:hypothetical protein [Steroidobacteraceae bacterium]